ncbi:hypothetical protein KAFR_0C02880 [Kazachstania africana CBS 2517]|uniref:Protein YIP n=1 Tax=Kazachstania africana (strain ATCC 22294 / BCRC 22015 / CBS 2517 / CECT 1963 / NBRC 1671 / NRRL Y-8276) TaxID=1071382 RepID=H2ASD1_KAZAF|nr:hypothetical protein KAFR_0C02880 [Kazachstania africana CBS 2517]CCF57281.1 hypothetical protein KAFR_0C02880 [Kazachstania africana CBS 2517]
MSDHIEADTAILPDTNYVSPELNSGSTHLYSTTMKRGTLDESIMETLKRDIFDINSRLKQVVYPHMPTRQLLATTEEDADRGNAELEQISSHCDLWAPLCFTILYSLFVSHAKSLFSSIFVLSWITVCVMALHLRLVKPYENVALISYISICGYCLFPQVINAILSQTVFPLLLKISGNKGWIIRSIIICKLVSFVFCMIWSLTAVSLATKSKGFVTIFPLAICLLGIGWLATML